MKYLTRKFTLVVFTTIVLFMTSMACSLPFLFQERNSVEISGDAAQSFEDTMEETVQDLKTTGVLELTITESEITSYIDTKLQEQQNPIFKNPQINFQEDRILLTGDVKQGNFTLPLKADLSVSADGSGGIDYLVNSASVGPMKLPSGMLNEMTSQIESALGSNISGKIPNLYIEEISVSDGIMVIKGHSK